MRVLGIFLACLLAFAASGQSVLDMRHTLTFAGDTYPVAFNRLEQLSGLSFIYSSDNLPKGKILNKVFKNETLRFILDEIGKEGNLAYTLVGVQVIWKKTAPTVAPVMRKCTLSGKIVDIQSGEEVIGAVILVQELKSGVVSNAYGFYSLTLNEGNYQISISSVGYITQSIRMLLQGDTVVHFQLPQSNTQLQEVVVTEEREKEDYAVRQTGMSNIKISPKVVRQIPPVLGEYDPVKALQLMPGVQWGSEGSTGFFVRGGSADQNLVMLDEAPIYSSSHLLGFFSIFNPDAVREVEMFKGGVPSRYGGRLSSVLDIRMKEGNTKRRAFSGGIGSLAARFTYEQPLVAGKDKGSVMIAARRSYIDALINALPSQDISQNTFNFFDLNLKAGWKIDYKNKIYVSSYIGSDNVGLQNLFGTSWGNQTLTFRWNHIVNKRLFSNMTVAGSYFRTKSNVSLQREFGYRVQYTLRDWTFKYDFSYFHNPRLRIDFGVNLIQHKYFFGKVEPLDNISKIRPLQIDPTYAVESALYADVEQEVSKKLSISYGLRFSRFDNAGAGTYYRYNVANVVAPGTSTDNIVDTVSVKGMQSYNHYQGFEPRVSVRWLINDNLSVKWHYNRTRQYLHQLSNTNTPSPVDMWAPVNRYIRPQIADQTAVGVFKNLLDNTYAFSAELYYKRFADLIDFKPQASLLLNSHLETEVLHGKGEAYGVEWLLKKQKGNFTGWVSYTWAKSLRQTPGINNGQVYPSAFDRRHNWNVVLTQKFGERMTLAATWVYGSGMAYTFPVGRYEQGPYVIPYYTSRNGFRLPPVHRLDLTLCIFKKPSIYKNRESSFNFTIYNVYARKNTYSYVFRQVDATRTEAVKIYLFTIVPSFTYNFSF